ncbi:hypothetical protein CSKR_203432 [Clonorchis sinensis]|uniref:Uncharacterized protein n=1 Tax=Clonorchis sinensis TaxID=79923 RepID=A0A8T1MAU5_CLOSI|nr:hypothetical protein CSKR_203432 [Clonorchis sinensis]
MDVYTANKNVKVGDPEHHCLWKQTARTTAPNKGVGPRSEMSLPAVSNSQARLTFHIRERSKTGPSPDDDPSTHMNPTKKGRTNAPVPHGPM